MNFTDRELRLLKMAADHTANDIRERRMGPQRTFRQDQISDAKDLERLSRIFSNIQNALNAERERERASGYKGLPVYK